MPLLPASPKIQLRLVVAVLLLLAPAAGAGAAMTGAPVTVQEAPRRTPATVLACTTGVAGKLPVQLALRHYIKGIEPRPLRFLNPSGTDSALSDMAAKVLQEFGPTYYYAGSEAAKHKLRERLADIGPYPALLVVRRSAAKPTATMEVIRLGGHFVTGELDGRAAKSAEYTYVCGAAGWELKAVKAEGAE